MNSAYYLSPHKHGMRPIAFTHPWEDICKLTFFPFIFSIFLAKHPQQQQQWSTTNNWKTDKICAGAPSGSSGPGVYHVGSEKHVQRFAHPANSRTAQSTDPS